MAARSFTAIPTMTGVRISPWSSATVPGSRRATIPTTNFFSESGPGPAARQGRGLGRGPFLLVRPDQTSTKFPRGPSA
ncbi:hypothetical protein FNJ84_04710 [Paracoccus sp. M683]|nr:hypothetical protein FNJ84_04710 [Paracoccus sp. M683]